MSAKRVPNDRGWREALEAFPVKHANAQFTHGIYPECMEKLCGDLFLEA